MRMPSERRQRTPIASNQKLLRINDFRVHGRDWTAFWPFLSPPRNRRGGKVAENRVHSVQRVRQRGTELRWSLLSTTHLRAWNLESKAGLCPWWNPFDGQKGVTTIRQREGKVNGLTDRFKRLSKAGINNVRAAKGRIQMNQSNTARPTASDARQVVELVTSIEGGDLVSPQGDPHVELSSYDDSIAAESADLLLAGLELTMAPDGRTFATTHVGARQKTFLIGSMEFRAWCRMRVFKWFGRALSAIQLAAVEGVIEAVARMEGKQENVWTRVGTADGTQVYIDLANSLGQVVEVTADGCQVLKEAPIKFWRPLCMLPLPVPTFDKSYDAEGLLQELIPGDFELCDFEGLLDFMVGALNPLRRFLVLELTGLQSSGKSDIAQSIKGLIDPSLVSAIATPINPIEFARAARDRWLTVVDCDEPAPTWLDFYLKRFSAGYSVSTHGPSASDASIISVARPALITSLDPIMRPGDEPHGFDPVVSIHCGPYLCDDEGMAIDIERITERRRPTQFGLLLRLLQEDLAGGKVRAGRSEAPEDGVAGIGPQERANKLRDLEVPLSNANHDSELPVRTALLRLLRRGMVSYELIQTANGPRKEFLLRGAASEVLRILAEDFRGSENQFRLMIMLGAREMSFSVTDETNWTISYRGTAKSRWVLKSGEYVRHESDRGNGGLAN